jgi:CRP-like cAMP-binding protein
MQLKGQVTWTGDLAHSIGAHNRIFQYDSIQDHLVAESFPNMLPEDLWVVLRQLGEIRTYAKGELLFSAEEAPKGVYLIDKGAVRINSPSPARKKILEESVGSGALLGLSESITGEDHKFTSEALEDTRTWFIERQDFLNFLRQNQVLCLQIVRRLSEDLHELYHDFQSGIRSTPRSRRTRL